MVGSGGNTLSSGVVDASAGDAQSTGGTVHVLGDNVGLIADATIDASGAAGGGTVLVGGDFQGGNPDINNATVTFVGPDAISPDQRSLRRRASTRCGQSGTACISGPLYLAPGARHWQCRPPGPDRYRPYR